VNIQETSRVLAKIQVFDNRPVDEATVLAWHEVLSDVDYEKALGAVSEFYRSERKWIMPADIGRLARPRCISWADAL
jgi:hypothetical protein